MGRKQGRRPRWARRVAVAVGALAVLCVAAPKVDRRAAEEAAVAFGRASSSTTDPRIVVENEGSPVMADLATAAPPPPPTTVAPTTSAPPPPAPAPLAALAPPIQPLTVQAAAAAGVGTPFTLDPYRGLGTWIDVYDWSVTFTHGHPAIGLAEIDRMADLNVQTLFVQASKWNSPTGSILEPERLRAIIQRARVHGIRVVGWYLPTLENPGWDLQILRAISALPLDGLAVDIEALNVPDVNERNRRLVELSIALRNALPGRVIGAIPLEPVVMEVVNPHYWPAFPWAQLAPLYDVWLPMSYWSQRRESSGYNDGYRYTAENIDRLRADLGRPQAPVHTVGGLANPATYHDVSGMMAAVADRGALGGSLYDYRTTAYWTWVELQAIRRR